MMVSVIICFYKEYFYIEQALLSLKFQIYKNFEIILIDDSGLTNNLELENILKKFKELNINYIKNKENIGLARSRNIGLNKSKGDFICFLDSDDGYFDNKLNEQVNEINKNDLDIVYCKEVVFRNKIYIDRHCDRSFSIEVLLKNQYINLNSLLISKKFILKNKIYFNEDEDSRYGEDLEYLINLRKKTNKIFFIDKYMTISRRRKDNHRNYKNIYKELEKIEKMYLSYLNDSYFKNYESIINQKLIDIKFKKLIGYAIARKKGKSFQVFINSMNSFSISKKFLCLFFLIIPQKLSLIFVQYVYVNFIHHFNYHKINNIHEKFR